MKAIKTTIGILASILAFGAIAQSADSASVTASDIANLTGQQTAPVWVDPGLSATSAAQVQNAINQNNALINQELAKRDATIANLQNQLNSLKTSGSGSSDPCPGGLWVPPHYTFKGDPVAGQCLPADVYSGW